MLARSAATARVPDLFTPFFLFLCLISALVFIGRFLNWLAAVMRLRRLHRIESGTVSARDLSRRLDFDAREADDLIKAYARQAYRRGSAS